MGTVEETTRSRDGLVRRVEIRYHNPSESNADCSKTTPRFTDRSVRSVIKLFNIDEGTWKDDMDKVARVAKACGLDITMETTDDDREIVAQPEEKEYEPDFGPILSSHLYFPQQTPINVHKENDEHGLLDTAGTWFHLYKDRDEFLGGILSTGTDLSLTEEDMALTVNE